MKDVRFEFSTELKAELNANGANWEQLLYKACLEGKRAECKAKLFAETLRKTGFRAGTGPARAAYRAVRNGADIVGMVAAVDVVKTKRKAVKPANDTLVVALKTAADAAGRDNLVLAEGWLVKAQAILEAVKATKAAEATKATKATKAADKAKAKAKANKPAEAKTEAAMLERAKRAMVEAEAKAEAEAAEWFKRREAKADA